MANGPTDRDASEGESGRGCRACTGRSRVDDTQVHLREPGGYSAREGGEWALRRWDCLAGAPTQGPACRGPIRPRSQVRGGLTRRWSDPGGT